MSSPFGEESCSVPLSLFVNHPLGMLTSALVVAPLERLALPWRPMQELLPAAQSVNLGAALGRNLVCHVPSLS